jgi:Na+/H+ antiporter NhaD/arsenite permease-like protein
VVCALATYRVFRDQIPAVVSPPEIDPITALTDRAGAVYGVAVLATCLVLLSLAPVLGWRMAWITLAAALAMVAKDARMDLQRRAPGNLPNVLSRVPWRVLPFVLGMFVLVEQLDQAGWLGLVASGLGAMVATLPLPLAIVAMVTISAAACNLMNNQPMTIFFTRSLQSPAFAANPVTTGALMFALVLGSNFGANFTLIGALAGIMWVSILRVKGVIITHGQFARAGFKAMPLVVLAAATVLALEYWS